MKHISLFELTRLIQTDIITVVSIFHQCVNTGLDFTLLTIAALYGLFGPIRSFNSIIFFALLYFVVRSLVEVVTCRIFPQNMLTDVLLDSLRLWHYDLSFFHDLNISLRIGTLHDVFDSL